MQLCLRVCAVNTHTHTLTQVLAQSVCPRSRVHVAAKHNTQTYWVYTAPAHGGAKLTFAAVRAHQTHTHHHITYPARGVRACRVWSAHRYKMRAFTTRTVLYVCARAYTTRTVLCLASDCARTAFVEIRPGRRRRRRRKDARRRRRW